ncbi:MAG: AraC family transcriptional regulator [Pyrinomonadaceae bacterium]
MAQNHVRGQKLQGGEHWGAVFHKRRTDSAVFCESVYKRSMDLPEHSHELGFFTLILDGYYSEILGRKNVLYSPRTVLWRQAGLTHKDRIAAASSRFFFVEIERQFADRLDQCKNVPEHLAECNGSLTWLASRLRSEIIAGDASSPLIIDGVTLEMLGLLIRQGKSLERNPPKWLRRVIERLNEEFATRITTESLAADAGVHPVHLAAVFRTFHQETIGDYVQKCRVSHAISMLRRSDISLAEIAFDCGFSDQSHFTRVFKRRIGMTPGAYRVSIS